MGLVRENVVVPLPPTAAEELWRDVRRWPSFIEGFAHALEVDRGWPAAGSRLVWQSIPGGRGRVTERVRDHEPAGRLVTQVFEEALTGTQTATCEDDDGGTRVALELRYELARGGPLRKITDVLFIRRALSESLGRTLRRFATEAREAAEEGYM